MKATGVVRRIDDLGRVVIPKEIRRNLRIREGDSLEIYVDNAGDVILKKYSPVEDLSEFSQQYADALYMAIQKDIIICDRDTIVAATANLKKKYVQKKISDQLEKFMNNRTTKVERENVELEISEDKKEHHDYVVQPILSNGDCVGAVIVLATDTNKDINEVDISSVKTASSFIGKYLEG
ncbi:MAG: stage sporulation protein [Haloplasmataceae bacterium]|jgi:AbrB family transcriptional regulator (stage V sporulation protein T)|nr:stage sporulation protein [Haloplasmataceae bacterium]